MERIRVLVADHCPIFCDGLCHILNNENDIEVIARTNNGEEALKLAKELKPDVAIIDANVPKFNGIGIARNIKKACPGTIILMLGTYDWESYVLASVRLGAAGYLLRDISANDLISSLRSVNSGELVYNMKAASHILRRVGSVGPDGWKEYEELNEREYDILRLVAEGMNNKEIASKLAISERTVQSHLESIFGKLRVRSRTEAAIHALKEGFLDVDQLP